MQVQMNLKRLGKSSEAPGLRMNIDKTEVVRLHPSQENPMKITGTDV